MIDRSKASGKRALSVRVAALVIGAALAGAPACGGSSGSGGGSSAGSSSTSGTPIGSAGTTVNQTHWDTALAALGSPYVHPGLSVSDPSLQGSTELFRNAWPAFEQIISAPLEQALRTQLAGLTASSGLVVTSIRSVTLDLGAPPRLSSRSPNQASLEIPAMPSVWNISTTLDLQIPVQTQFLGIPIQTTIAGDVTVEVKNLRMTSDVNFDLSDPTNPRPISSQSPQVTFQLVVSSNTTGLNALTGAISQVLDPVIRTALALGSVYIQQQLTGAIQGVTQPAWGLGGPGVQAVASPVNLEALALQISDEIQAVHTPFETVVDAVFDQPGYGNGNVVSYGGYGDSAIWTGHYLMAEALRFDFTGETKARLAAEKVFEGLRKCIDVSAYDGQLSRCVIPVSSPQITSIVNGLDYSVGIVDGVAYGCEGNISRDQYLGTVMGMVHCYLRVPTLKDRSRVLINRMVDYMVRNHWVAYQHDGVTPARGLFAQTPNVVWAMVKAANLVDPNRWGALHTQYRDLPAMGWFSAWAGNLDVMSGYFKYNLGHATAVIQASTETDPSLYRDYVRTIETTRIAVGHHNNGWFDSVYAFLVPARAQAFGQLVEMELQRWTLRTRRRQTTDFRNDPTIAKGTYSTTPVGSNSGTGALGGSQTKIVALFPLPIEKRAHTDYLWQRDPFTLNKHGDPRRQPPAVDLVLPYWLGRSYGFVQ